ncbi:tripartite tricarboxylate transporter substrate binding protein [Cupriavidus pauculus]|uniref:Bug family tripartite tricarboxylate transporter substrate binding protein n=1 Tax=Cupriavidus pauculus TaxID=82633 RepID=UPI001EE31170|nr:tripartite tricarboxylate transporter substrate binding protein [Cupriavidus pauculus]GJG98575.1 tripartite tricarboxylate transporter substrate binding protein [Cupriavidus pauculus]
MILSVQSAVARAWHGACWMLCLMMALATGMAHAEYPDRPIKLVVGFPPGGGGDLYGRLIADQISRKLGQPVVVENKGGAGGMMAAEQVARSKPDGYTLLMGMSSNMSLAAAIRGKELPYRVPEDFVAVGMLVQAPHGLFASADRYSTAKAALADARTRQMSYGSSGPGSVGYVTMEMVKAKAGVEIAPIPYRGSGPAITDLLGGHTDLFFATAPPIMGQVKGGKLKLLALTGEQRTPAFPDVPTFRELGIDVTVTQWYGLVAPAGTPNAIVQKLSRAVSEGLENAELRRVVRQDGAREVDMSTDRFRQYIVDDIARYRAGISDKLLKTMEVK